MKKIKLKKKIKKLLLILIAFTLIFIITNKGIKYYKQKQYEKTYEYKLINKGYSKESTTLLLKKYKDKEIEYILNNEQNNIYIDLIKDKYFIYDYFYDYLDYYKESNIIRNIIETINTKTNKPYYEDTLETDISKNELMLVNKYYYLKEDYVPDNLVTISTQYSWGDYGSQKVTKETYEAFLNMWKESHENGYYLMVSSSYRPYAKQKSVYDDYKKNYGEDYANNIAAHPGFSEHQTGLSLDIFEKGYTQKTFQDSESYQWLLANAYKYGFILRYPKDKEKVTGFTFESWHFRYVGIQAATYIHDNNITFDEYYAYFVK